MPLGGVGADELSLFCKEVGLLGVGVDQRVLGLRGEFVMY